MRIFNLDPNFAPLGKGVEFQQFDFPSGCEPHIKIPAIGDNQDIKITCRIRSGNDLMKLFLLVDALRRFGVGKIELFIPYLPFARQDRVMVKGEPLSVKVIADLINSMKLNKVTVFDPHSEVCLALIDNVEALNNHSLAKQSIQLRSTDDFLIISPDAGAYKKIFKVCQHLGYDDNIVLCNKDRNVSTGEITKMTCPVKDFQGRELYIIDDICDGGGTFVMLAEGLKARNAGKINLIVSHGIFSKGIDALKHIDRIYTTNSFSDLQAHPKLTQWDIATLI
jgi:ribose-phosphate pyrophosphokinase